MLTPEYLQDMPENIMNIFSQLEGEIISDISRRIYKGMELAVTADYQINALAELGYNLDDIEKEIAKATKLGEKEIEKMLKESAYLSHENDRKKYKIGGKTLPKITPAMDKFILATIKQTKGDLRNISNSLGIATGKGHKDLTTFYQDTLNHAIFQLGSGAFDYNTILKQAVKPLADSGVRRINYESGVSNHVDVAVRRAMMTGSSQITGYMSEINADMMDQDLMEITSHAGARPDHAEWQGEVVSRAGDRGYLSLDEIGYGDVTGFKGANCRHDWFAYFPGISKPSRRAVDPPDFKYNGKTYSAYQASQYQRAIERRIRKSKRELIIYDSAGLDDSFTASSVKLARQRGLYKDFSRKAKLRPRNERHQVYKFGRSVSAKAVHAGRR